MDYVREKILDCFGEQVLTAAVETLADYLGTAKTAGSNTDNLLTKEQKKQVEELSDLMIRYLDSLCKTESVSREDRLTGLLSKTYFENRMNVIDRAEIVPVAVLHVNINDWKYANEHFGYEESDRLIRIVAGILQKEAKADYIIGRIDGDVFAVLIPMVQEGEAEAYIRRIKERCDAFPDSHLTPSVAAGMVIKTNIEEKLEGLLSDAEYEMFQDKLEMKGQPGYRERLIKGI